MPGMGQKYLPRPQFSSENPYWWGRDDRMTFLRHELRPKPTAKDFLYATTWEIWRRDVHMANCVRIAVQRTVRINFRVLCRAQIRAICLNQKEKQSEKTV
jgi:hypothetical protein